MNALVQFSNDNFALPSSSRRSAKLSQTANGAPNTRVFHILKLTMWSLLPTLYYHRFFSTRIQRMGERIFTLCVSPHIGGGGGVPHLRSGWGWVPHSQVLTQGYPIPRSGWGTPFPGLDWGYTSQVGFGGTTSQVQMGVPGVLPIQVRMGGTLEYTLPRTGWGTPSPGQDWVTFPIQDWMGYLPPTPPFIQEGNPPSPGLDGVTPPQSRTGWGNPPSPGLDGVTPPPIQDWMG